MRSAKELAAGLREIADDYHNAPSGLAKDDQHNRDWDDKPHRLVYRLCGHLREAADYIERTAAPAATHRHRKRGTTYSMVGIGKMQARGWRRYDGRYGNPIGSVDGCEVVVYRSVEDGSLWVRPREEFEDGRFEQIDQPAPPVDALNEDDAADLQEGRPYQDVLAAKRTAPPTDGLPEFETTAEERARLARDADDCHRLGERIGGWPAELFQRLHRDLATAIAFGKERASFGASETKRADDEVAAHAVTVRSYEKWVGELKAERDREAAARREAHEDDVAANKGLSAALNRAITAEARAEQAEAREATLREKYDNLQRQWMRCANRSDEYLEALEKIADQPTAADIARAALATTSTGEGS